jgi:hypothetical protein
MNLRSIHASSYNCIYRGMACANSMVDYPANPSSTGTPLAQNCAIPLGAVGSTTSITVPYTAGGRLWFSIGGTITFLLNPSSTGAQLVEPSSTNTADPNYNLRWDFCEFSYSSSEIYINISYVDFVGIPIGLELTNTSGTVTHVSGLPANGLDTIANNLVAQNNKDGAGWDQLIIKASDGSNLRVLNPTGGIDFNPSLFQNYWSNYVDQIWSEYVSTPLVVDTQYTWGTVSGNTSNDRTSISFNGVGSFTKPGAADIFGQNTGPFAAQSTNTAELLNIGARLSTAINRSTLLTDANQPDGETVASYYTNSVTNHYARIVHAANLDGRGYCFPYDDVGNSNEVDQSGYLSDASPQSLLVTVGGGNASAKLRARLAAAEKPRTMKRSMVMWNEDVKEQLPEYHDLERGEHPKLMNEMAMATPEETSRFKLPSALERILGRYLEVNSRSLAVHYKKLMRARKSALPQSTHAFARSWNLSTNFSWHSFLSLCGLCSRGLPSLLS